SKDSYDVTGGEATAEPPRKGLVMSDAWKDENGTPSKKTPLSDAQRKEKRQKTLSLKTKKISLLQEYKGVTSPTAEMEGLLERKHELQKGQVKAPIRSWKQYYTVLCGQLLVLLC
ncbi:MAG: hypothetical protein ACHQFW_03755, partial [Chitinophagales bacterium]